MGSHGHITVHKDTKIAGSRSWFDLVRIDMEVTVWTVLVIPLWAATDKLRLTRVQLQSMTAHSQADIWHAARQLVSYNI